ncbi:hypothetical protein D3C78_1623170 [compost metagenome]
MRQCVTTEQQTSQVVLVVDAIDDVSTNGIERAGVVLTVTALHCQQEGFYSTTKRRTSIPVAVTHKALQANRTGVTGRKARTLEVVFVRRVVGVEAVWSDPVLMVRTLAEVVTTWE